MSKGLIIPQCFSKNFKCDMYINTSAFLNVFFWMDCWISIGRLGLPYIWGCSKFRSQQLILLSSDSRLVYAFIFQCPKDLSFHNVSQNDFQGDMYVNTSSFNVFFWMDCWISIGRLGLPYIWGCSKFRSQQLILLSSKLVCAFIFQCLKDLSFHNASQKT